MTVITLDSTYIDALERLENECFSDPWSKEQLTDSLQSGIFFGAVENGTICGYVGFYTAADVMEILNVAVSPAFRRRGIAGILLNKAEETAKEKQCRVIFLEVRQSNTAARALYEKYGYTVDGTRKNYYNNPTEHAVLMHKEIFKT